MQSKGLLLLANEQCAALVLPLLQDLRTAPLVSPTPIPGNHAHWVLGHLVFAERQFRSMMDGTPNPAQAWESMFGGGSQPSPAGEGYPGYAELLDRLETLHADTLAWLRTLNESDLDRPSLNIPPGFEPFFGTWGRVLLMRAMHWMNHRGQLADCRRSAGRTTLMV